jgi:hypothetical protein
MRHTLLIALGATALLSACGNARDSLMDRSVRNLEDQVALLGTVTDDESAARAMPRARALASEARELEARMRENPASSREEQARVVEKFRERLKGVMEGMAVQRKRVAMVPGGPPVLAALRAQ